MLVKVGAVAGQIPPQQRRVRGKDRDDRPAIVRDPRHRDAGHPLVKMRQYRPSLRHVRQLAEKFCHGEPERDDLVDFPVAVRHGDPVVLPQQVLVVIEVRKARPIVEQDHPRPAGDQPTAEVTRDPRRAQPVERLADDSFGRALFEFQRRGRGVIRADQAITIVPALDHAVGLGAQDGVDPAELPADFPPDLKEQRRLCRGRGVRSARHRRRRRLRLRRGLFGPQRRRWRS